MSQALCDQLALENLGGTATAGIGGASVKLRSAQAPLPATVTLDGQGGGDVVLDEPAFGVAPGQACVAYDGDRLLGGGWIRRA